jgi:hypothetical protein
VSKEDLTKYRGTAMPIEECQNPLAITIQRLTEENKRLRTELAVAEARAAKAEAQLRSDK